jgi:hypothetical protein
MQRADRIDAVGLEKAGGRVLLGTGEQTVRIP